MLDLEDVRLLQQFVLFGNLADLRNFRVIDQNEDIVGPRRHQMVPQEEAEEAKSA